MRNAMLALVVLALGTAAAPAQTYDWANKLFKAEYKAGDPTITHNFGSVARGAQLYHRFPLKNVWAVPIEIMSVRVSCGCVTATPTATKLQPRETGYLDVTMDTRRFPAGAKTVSIYVMVGPEYTSTATLQVSTVSRADVVFNPGEVSFGVVAAGQTPVQNIDVEYAGALDWRVKEVLTNGAPVEAKLEEWYRQPGEVGKYGYHVKVSLKPDAPPGTHRWELLLKTNDPAGELVPLLVEATVQASLTVSPASLNLGNPRVGELVSRRVIISGSKPFTITAIDGVGDGIQAELPTTPAARQIVNIKIQPGKAGDLRRQLQVKTDLGGAAPVTVTVEGTVEP